MLDACSISISGLTAPVTKTGLMLKPASLCCTQPELQCTSCMDIDDVCTNLADILNGVPASQVVQLLVLWAVFLIFQMVKSKYGNCTKEYLMLFLAQTVFCISVTTFFMRRELADLGKPAAQQQGDPEMHQLLLGQRGTAPDGKILFTLQFCFWSFHGILSTIQRLLSAICFNTCTA